MEESNSREIGSNETILGKIRLFLQDASLGSPALYAFSIVNSRLRAEGEYERDIGRGADKAVFLGELKTKLIIADAMHQSRLDGPDGFEYEDRFGEIYELAHQLVRSTGSMAASTFMKRIYSDHRASLRSVHR